MPVLLEDYLPAGEVGYSRDIRHTVILAAALDDLFLRSRLNPALRAGKRRRAVQQVVRLTGHVRLLSSGKAAVDERHVLPHRALLVLERLVQVGVLGHGAALVEVGESVLEALALEVLHSCRRRELPTQD